MKYFFYTILLVASLGTVGAIVNPALVQQGAALIGLELPQTATNQSEQISSEDQLARFLEQYPFARNQNNATIPTATVPAVVFPEPAPPPIPPFHVAPATSFPMPVADTPAPMYANPVHVPIQSPPPPDNSIPDNSHGNSSWDSAAAVMVFPPPAVEYHLPTAPVADHWTVPVQPHPVQPHQELLHQEPLHQEPWLAPAPQQSIYAPSDFHHPPPHSPPPAAFVPQQEVFHVINDPFPPRFEQIEQTRYTPLNHTHMPPPPPQPMQQAMMQMQQQTFHPPPPHATLQTPTMLIEEVPVHGTEMVARVGTQVILMGDILPRLRRMAQKIVDTNIEQMPEERRTEVTQQEIAQVMNAIAANLYRDMLEEQILFALVYSDYISQQGREQRNMFNERLGEEFDRREIPEMLREFNVENVAALRRHLEQQLGSSLEKERRAWIREQIVRQWINMSIERATGAATHDEMMDFYERNIAMFTSPARARWQEMVVLFSRHSTEHEAEQKMRWMGNQVANGVPFEEIARMKSDGFTAPDGGVWDWTTRGSLTSAELEHAIFSQPSGQLSPRIIRSDRGLHIIRVLERREEEVVPFIEAQVTIRDRIRNQRTQQHQEEYLAELRRRFPTVVVRDRIDFDITNTRTASR